MSVLLLPLEHTVIDELGQACAYILTKWSLFFHTFIITKSMFNGWM